MMTENREVQEVDLAGIRDHLCVDAFLQEMIPARALKTAFETGLVDHLVSNRICSVSSLENKWKNGEKAVRLLIDLLALNNVIANHHGEIELTPEFLHALKYRDLLELKLSMAHLAAFDLMNNFTEFIASPLNFMRKARFFKLFDYSLCFEDTPENRSLTKRWMMITSILTRYEAPACMACHDFGRYGRMLDIGGNSGEFALRICRRYPGMVSTVFDLPLVCDLGREHLQSEPESDRITFARGNALTDELPGGFDLITFKSMLHDWPQDQAERLISKAEKSLKPGGTLLIFERAPMEITRNTVPFSLFPFLIFLHSYRLPDFYERQLKKLGFEDIATRRIHLDMPFFLVEARKKMGS
jgi:SAM-dependent methyltransferase